MKLNKLISKGLTLGIILNSISVISYANTEIPNRYQTLEGEYITIDDSTEGNLEEIEIFGNTVQDENNLEDIQSVGDLHVDKNGNPILDNKGREQYKIDVVTTGKNLLDLNYTNENRLKSSKTLFSEFSLDLVIGKTYTFSAKTNLVGVDGSKLSYCLSYDDRYYLDNPNRIFAYVGGGNSIKITFTAEKTKAYFIGGVIDSSEYWDFQLEEGSSNTSYQVYSSDKKTILLPAQLQKVGNIADRLYWDNSEGRYLIEKNITSILLDGSDDEDWVLSRGVHSDVYDHFRVIPHTFGAKEGIPGYGNPLLSNRFLCTNEMWSRGPHNSITTSSSLYTQIGMTFDMYYYQSLDDFKSWLNENPTTVYYQLKTPEIIKTNITSKLVIPTYDEKTYIYVETKNGVNPALKVTIDRLPQIAKEAVAQAERDNTTHNIALARRYINMLPESSYKDQLQNQLSEIFSSDIVLDRKTATSNLDVYIKSENILQMSLDTNQISFDDFSGIEDVEKLNAVNLTINSSLPYQLNAYLPSEIQNSDKTKTLDKSILNIKENSESAYQTFSNTIDKVVLKDNCSSGNYLTHGVDLKLAGGIAHEKDVYKATIKLEVEQK